MNRDDIIRMAFEVSDGVLSYDAEGRWILSEQEVIRLTALVAAAEREACARICEDAAQRWRDAGFDDYSMLLKDAAHQLRSRNPP